MNDEVRTSLEELRVSPGLRAVRLDAAKSRTWSKNRRQKHEASDNTGRRRNSACGQTQ